MLTLLYQYKCLILGSNESVGSLYVAYNMSCSWNGQSEESKRRCMLERQLTKENSNIRRQQATIVELQDAVVNRKTELRRVIFCRSNESRAYHQKRQRDEDMLHDMQSKLDEDEDLEKTSKEHFNTLKSDLQDSINTLKTGIQQAKKKRAASVAACHAAAEALVVCETDRPWRKALSPAPPRVPSPNHVQENRGHCRSHR